MTKMLFIMLGGSIGALCRWSVSLLAARLFGTGFPWGTLAVNLTGCFLIGFCFSLAERSAFMGPSVRLFFVTGFLGALTTFSTYGIETVQSLRTGAYMAAALNFLSNNIGGLALALLGLWVGRIR